MTLLIVLAAKYLFIVSIVLYLYQLWKLPPKNREKLIILSIISFPLSYVVAKISSHFIYDPRPFMVDHVNSLFAHAADNGFPSDHMLLTMTIASIVFIYNKKLGIILTIIAICVGTARVLANIHHLVDILGSMAIAIASTYVAYNIFSFLLRLGDKEK